MRTETRHQDSGAGEAALTGTDSPLASNPAKPATPFPHPSRVLTRVLYGISAFVFLLALMTWSFLERPIRMECRRVEPQLINCSKKWDAPLFGKTVQIRALTGAHVEEYRSTDSDGNRSTTYGVVLETRNGEVDWRSGSSSGFDGKQRVADRIEEAVSGTDATFSIVDKGSYWRHGIAAFLFLFASGFFAAATVLRRLRRPV